MPTNPTGWASFAEKHIIGICFIGAIVETFENTTDGITKYRTYFIYL